MPTEMLAGTGTSSAMILRGKNLERFGEPAKFLPVAFIVSLVTMLYSIYMRFHAWPKFLLGSSWYVIVFNSLTSLLLICYARCILVSPGTVPDQEVDPSWTYQPKCGAVHADQPGTDSTSLTMQEAKRSGDRRSCKWCAKYKPDRCHHCRVCRKCILKMDHHCPWIYNCVGYYNHKFFFLLLFYVFLSTHLIMWTMAESVKRAVDTDRPFWDMFILLFGETLCVFLTVLVTAFFGFHIWLMCKAMTTIEFCEKSMKKSQYFASAYHRDGFGDLQEVLGRNPLLWLLPIHDQCGDGLQFVNEQTRLGAHVDLSAASRRSMKAAPRRASARRSLGPAEAAGSK